ncbi:nitroreductase [Pseudomonas gingeri]|uniref:nitroreductase n=1 Tax=Pseudomonas gingeri TaxID=117681 RepID=UPI0015A40D06|nr:nitroreductase [Pseudomonas gingeri]NWD66927.1 nitroreductase [Pseudomonas gingeri]
MTTISVSDAVQRRRSVRAFLPQPVPGKLLRKILHLAGRTPSGGDVLPWRVYLIAGDELLKFKSLMSERLRDHPQPDPEYYPIYPQPLEEPYRSRRYRVGEMLHQLMGIARDDKVGRACALARNYVFFDAPVGLFCFVDKKMGNAQWSDVGMYLQTLMLLLEEQGLSSCTQEAWSLYHRVVNPFVGAPDDSILFCGMSIGYVDPEATMNRLNTERMELADFATLRGFID